MKKRAGSQCAPQANKGMDTGEKPRVCAKEGKQAKKMGGKHTQDRGERESKGTREEDRASAEVKRIS